VVAVGNKSFVVAAALLLMLVSPLGMLNVAEANPTFSGFHFIMDVSIQSPTNGAVSSLPVLVNFTVEGLWFPSNSSTQSFFYVVDGQNMTSGNRVTQIQYPQFGTPTSPDGQWYDYSGQVNLTSLSKGLHNVTVYYGIYDGTVLKYNETSSATSQATTQFYVDIILDPLPTQISTPSFPSVSPSFSTELPRISSPSKESPSPTVPEFAPVAVLVLGGAACLFAVALRKKVAK
jgi:hypothetical protein